jgi:rSAM/selenodomain-associated transferase 2
MTDRVPLLTVVIPTLDEGPYLPGVLKDLTGLRISREVLVVDGGSRDGTCRVARSFGAVVVESPRGRGVQLRAGAAAARARLLCFLHADVRLPGPALAALDHLARIRPAGAHAFTLRIDAPGLSYRVIEAGANLRARHLGLPFGDQGLVVRRDDYERAGGYPSYPVMEDVSLIRALRQTVGIRVLDAPIRVSARRWRREGPLRRSLRNQLLLLRYLAGADPMRLARAYLAEGQR